MLSDLLPTEVFDVDYLYFYEAFQTPAVNEAETGLAEWEVRIELASHDDTVRLAERLDTEGIPVVRRHTFLLVGAATEDDAAELAKRLAAEAPKGATVHVQPGGEMIWEVTPPNPFVMIAGGLGG